MQGIISRVTGNITTLALQVRLTVGSCRNLRISFVQTPGLSGDEVRGRANFQEREERDDSYLSLY